MVEGPDGEAQILVEHGQMLVVSVCDDYAAFAREQRRIRAFADRMARGLDQAAVLVLAFSSDSFLIEYQSKV